MSSAVGLCGATNLLQIATAMGILGSLRVFGLFKQAVMQEYIEFFKANPMLSLVWVGLFVALVVSMLKSATSKIKSIGHQELTILVNRQDAKVVDVRGKEEFKKGHIVDALNVSLAEIKNNQASALEKLKASPIIVVCNAGMTSSQAAQLLVNQGFEQVYNLKGGMGDWLAANMPVTKSKR
jgi:rhodanese-related sulfurtransferase